MSFEYLSRFAFNSFDEGREKRIPEKFIIDMTTVEGKMMRKLSNLLWLSFLLSLFTLGFEGISKASFAQIRGEDSDRFFRQGNEVMEQQIRELQRENIRQQQEETQAQNEDDNDSQIDQKEDFEVEREEKERELETGLEIKEPSDIKIREVPDNPAALDDNVPESPHQEIKIGN